jgi:hypothetical protein
MKKSIAFFLVFLVTNSMFSQLLPTGTVTTDNKYRSGAIGIGYTTAPTFGTNKFMVNGNSVFAGNIVAGATSSTDGINAFSLQYGSVTESLSNWGSLRSSSATYMSFGVKASPTIADGWQSTTSVGIGRMSFAMSAGYGFQFLTAPSQITTAGTAVAMTEVMRIDNAGKVGIGTIAPLSKLEVAGDLAIGSGSVNANTTKLYINNPAGKKWAFSSGLNNFSENSFGIYNWTASQSTPLFNITDTGNVGIGVTSPTSKLDVAGNTRINGNLNIINTTNKIVGFDDPVNYYIGSYPVTGSAGFDIHSHGGIRFGDQTGNVMQIKDGKVGIGTILPTEKLDVVGNAKISSYSPTLILQRDNNTGGYIQGIQTKLLDGTNNWFSGVLGDSSSNSSVWRVSKGDYNNPYLSVFDNGYVAIGDATPYAPLGILKAATSTSHIFFGNPLATAGQASAKLTFAGTGIQHTGFAWIPGTTFDNGKLNLSFGGSNDSSLNPVKMTFQSDGKVGIGSTNPDEKLTVKGKIHAEEVRIDLLVPADYVFQKYYTGKSSLKADYTMPTLDEVAKYTKVNNHLPSMPSAEEMKKNGVELGEMNNLLLQKIEELTLYMIEMKKEVNTIKAENKELKSELKAIKEIK